MLPVKIGNDHTCALQPPPSKGTSCAYSKLAWYKCDTTRIVNRICNCVTFRNGIYDHRNWFRQYDLRDDGIFDLNGKNITLYRKPVSLSDILIAPVRLSISKPPGNPLNSPYQIRQTTDWADNVGTGGRQKMVSPYDKEPRPLVEGTGGIWIFALKTGFNVTGWSNSCFWQAIRKNS